MKLLNPSGLWLLLGIPVLIVIYLIRSQHEDRPVSSTYIWKLSSRFMKKRLPLQKLRRLLIFILQLLMIASVALMAARPAFITGKRNEYIAIIDASASMRIADDRGVTRFERALKEVRALADCIDKGHRLSVILAGDKASYLLQSSESANNVNLALASASCGYGSCDIEQALSLIQPLGQKAPIKVYFYTDTDHPGSENIRIHNLNKNEWNISVDGMRFQTGEEGEEYLVGLLTSHHRDASMHVGLRVDGIIHSAKTAQCTADTQTEVYFLMTDIPDYETLEIFIEEKDGLEADNRYCLCAGHQRSYHVLLASQSPLYLQSALSALDNCTVSTVSTLDQVSLTGYDLYIFDGLYPEKYPTDGSVLQFGTEKLPQGLDTQAQVEWQTALSRAGGVNSPMLTELELFDTVLARCTPLSGNAQWQTLLLADEKPVCMTQDLGTGQRLTVCGFDLHHSNLPMQTDYVVMMRNFVSSSVFDILDRTDYNVGETVTLSVLPAAQELYVQLPDGQVKSLSTGGRVSSLALEATGLYTAVTTTHEGGDYADFFVHIPPQEATCPNGDAISAPEGLVNGNGQDAMTQLWPYFAGLLLILLLAEWGVYHYEQY